MKKLIFSFLFLSLISHVALAELHIDKLPLFQYLEPKYQKLIDKNGHITDLKEFNKNGKVLLFQKKNGYKYIIMYKRQINLNGTKKNIISACNFDNFAEYVVSCFPTDGVDLHYYMEAKLDLDNFYYYDDITTIEELKKKMRIKHNYFSYEKYLSLDYEDRFNNSDIKIVELGSIIYDKQQEAQIKKLLNI